MCDEKKFYRARNAKKYFTSHVTEHVYPLPARDRRPTRAVRRVHATATLAPRKLIIFTTVDFTDVRTSCATHGNSANSFRFTAPLLTLKKLYLYFIVYTADKD